MTGGGPRHFERLRQTLFGRRYWSKYRFTAGNEVQLFLSGEAFFTSLIERVDAAEKDVVLETYIFCNDSAGQAVSAALLRAADRGVRVRVITDGIGTARLPLFNDWPARGVEHRIYNPHLFGRFGFSRTHRKLAVVDDKVAWCGGINIVDDYENDGVRLPYRRWDFAVELQGPVVADIREAIETAMAADSLRPPAGRVTAARFRAQGRYAAPARRATAATAAPICGGAGEPVRGVRRARQPDQPPRDREGLSHRDRSGAQRRCCSPILTSCRAASCGARWRTRRGAACDVKLIIGRKEFAALDYAVPFLYRSLLKAGVQIAEYEKTMLHGKVAVVDSNWGTVGSSNLDALSLMLNNEANVVLVNDPQIDALREAILTAFDEVAAGSTKRTTRPAGRRARAQLAGLQRLPHDDEDC